MNKDIMKELGLQTILDVIERGQCPFCKKNIDKTKFRNDQSLKEYEISGLCQECQDETFGED